MKICPNCEKDFYPNRPFQKYCSAKCRHEWRYKNNSAHIQDNRKKWEKLHPEKVRAYREKSKPQKKEWERTHRAQIRASRYESFESYLLRNLYTTRIRARNLGLDINIDHAFLMQSLKEQKYRCATTGILLTHTKRGLRSVSIVTHSQIN